MLEIRQCAGRLAHRIGHCCRPYAELLRQPEECLPVSTRVCGHRPQPALLKEGVLIAEDRISDNQMPATASVPPRSSARNAAGTKSPAGANKIAPSKGLRRRVPRVADGVSAELGGQLPVGLAPSQDMDAQALRQGHCAVRCALPPKP